MRKIILSLCLAGLMTAPSYSQSLQPGTPVIKVQSGDAAYRLSVLEEQVRQLNGRVEELTFRLLEMQEQMRRTQEDNDFRMREIEDKQGSNGGSSIDDNLASNSGEPSLEKPQPSEQSNDLARSDGNTLALPDAPKPKRTIDGVEIYDGEPGIADSGNGSLGIIQFDENGNIIDTEIGKPLELGGNSFASLDQPLPQEPEALFQVGYELVQVGRYVDAERALLTFSDNHPGHPRMPEARFWLGESHLGRKEFQEAAKVYLDAHKRWPSSKFGPQSLLKLGVSVAGLNQRELACATFAEVLTKYPNASRAIQRGVAFEQQSARCGIN